MDEASLDRFRMKQSVLDDVNSEGTGTRLVYEDGVWRAFHLNKGKPVGLSSGGWGTMEEALKALVRKANNERKGS